MSNSFPQTLFQGKKGKATLAHSPQIRNRTRSWGSQEQPLSTALDASLTVPTFKEHSGMLKGISATQPQSVRATQVKQCHMANTGHAAHLWDKGQKIPKQISFTWEELEREGFSSEDQIMLGKGFFNSECLRKKLEFYQRTLIFQSAFNYVVKKLTPHVSLRSPSPVRARKEQDSCTEGWADNSSPRCQKWWEAAYLVLEEERASLLSSWKGNTFGLLLSTLQWGSVWTSGHM